MDSEFIFDEETEELNITPNIKTLTINRYKLNNNLVIPKAKLSY